MKITFVGPAANLSGGNRVVAIYAQRLSRRGHDVTVVTQAAEPPSLRSRIKSLLKGDVSQLLPNLSPNPTHFDDIDVDFRVVDEFRPLRDDDVPDADVVIATWWETAEWVERFAPKKGAKAYFVQHHEVFEYVPQDRARATYRMPLHKIVVARWLQDVMRDEYGDGVTSLVANGVDLAQFNAPPRGRNARPTVGLMYAAPSWKGTDLSLRAFHIACGRLPGLKLVAFGPDAEMPRLPLPLGCELTVRPAQSSIRDIYARADAWLFGSRSEGFGLPLLESMACRTPVIGTPAGAAPELIAEGGGVLVPMDDAEAMARAIERVCTMPDGEWRALSDAAYATAQAHDWEHATVLFEQALEMAVERDKRGELRAR